VVVKLQSVAIGAVSSEVDRNSRTAFARLAVLIFEGHNSIGEIALANVKVEAIHRN
jgi:hypothetical protein